MLRHVPPSAVRPGERLGQHILRTARVHPARYKRPQTRVARLLVELGEVRTHIDAHTASTPGGGETFT
jgi:hypothetical protein